MVAVLKNYLLVSKPGVVFGNLIAAAGGFLLAAKGHLDLGLILPALVGITLVVASACVFNNCIDRNLDRKMIRTCNRPLARRTISLPGAVCYGTLLGITGGALLWTATNLLAFVIVLAGFVIYVGMYSFHLKRNSIYGALIGSLAGTAPPLAGYCAVNNRFDLGALILLSIFSLWQMPHCYAIALFSFDDYAAATIPVVPVTRGRAAAKKHIIGYILAYTVATLMLSFCGYTGYGYLAVSAILGLSWLWLAWVGFRTSNDRLWAKRLFVFSILSILVLSVMMSIDFRVAPADRLDPGQTAPAYSFRTIPK